MIDLKKPVQTIDGRPVTILAVLENPQQGQFPVVYSTIDCAGKEYVSTAKIDGTMGPTYNGKSHPDTLMNVPAFGDREATKLAIKALRENVERRHLTAVHAALGTWGKTYPHHQDVNEAYYLVAQAMLEPSS